MLATLRLFKSVPVKEHTTVTQKAYSDICKLTMPKGFVFDPSIIGDGYNIVELIENVEKCYGIDAKQLNNTFHKSWGKVANSPYEDLVVEQVSHYLTTYGRDCPAEYALTKSIEFGIPDRTKELLDNYKMDIVYFPDEILKVPELKLEKIKLVIIKALTKEELVDKITSFLSSGLALSEESVKDSFDICDYLGITDFGFCKNKEVNCMLHEKAGTFPIYAVEFLRFLVYLSTKDTLLIKSREVISAIKDSTFNYAEYLQKYIDKYGDWKLASIFYRFKPLFLAMRKDIESKKIINRIRRSAVVHHKPMPVDILNSITSCKDTIKFADVFDALENVNTFRKIRLAYALNYRLTEGVSSILYSIRNGKGFVKEFENTKVKEDTLKALFRIVCDSIVTDMSKNVKGKKVYVSNDVNYALPSSEKKFIGNVPEGTYVSVKDNLVFGINWHNVGSTRVDLDLSAVSLNEKIGWDGYYRSNTMLFSGDITDARKGATESFYVKKGLNGAFVIYNNYYNQYENTKDLKVPFTFFVAKQEVDKLTLNYTVDPNNVLLTVKNKVMNKHESIAVVVPVEDENRVYLTSISTSKARSARNDEVSRNLLNYYYTSFKNHISLIEMLKLAGAELVDTLDDEVDIDLSYENLEKDTIINLFK